ncbi:uncharacterized protein LOC114296005 [Camellia sinensis]|uniref:uncharacterized protein LOC114296005 n=1 Tax=Camellia sinensis TaxID=4442 RepID=UPI001035B4A1|nr:uncharacterized protein LOC114296005 [Camellia sinensis]XP_028096089.1 uncharacterized protein LOC114296005 [Camellia sinensis]
MDEVRSLLSLRALILNDNEIVSICRLDQLKELNTLVLSRNPINKLGESLVKVKSITKLSLSNCQLQAIDSLKSCTELKELRLAHNDTKVKPSQKSLISRRYKNATVCNCCKYFLSHPFPPPLISHCCSVARLFVTIYESFATFETIAKSPGI